MEATAYIKYLRISPKKVKPLGDLVVGMHPLRAVDRLLIDGRKGARILADVISSAFFNAKNNLKLDPDNLRIKTVEVLKGPFFKRWQPVARGMAHQIKKRTTHIKVTITSEEIEKKEIHREEGFKKGQKVTQEVKDIKKNKK